MPKISVLMTAYNSEKFIAEAIDSILNQTFTDFEFIIINDGSTDKTAEIVNKYTDKRIRFIDNKHNQGLIAVLNQGLDLCRGEYIARMDSDDISLPQRFEKQVAYLDANPDVGILGTAGQNFGANNYVNYLPEIVDAFVLLREVGFYHPSIMMRKSVLDKYNLRYNSDYYLVEDYELWACALKYTKMRNLQEVLLKYRVHPTSVSNANSKLQENNKVIVRKRILDFISNDNNVRDALLSMAGIDSGFMRKSCFYLVNCIPLIHIIHKSYDNKKIWLFKYFPLLKIKHGRVYLFHFLNVGVMKEQKQKIHFIHRVDNTNTGDMASCPLQYFPDLGISAVNVHDIYNINLNKINRNDIVIFGGGGLFDCLESWNRAINDVLDKCKNCFAWGVGFNTHANTHVQTKINFNKFKKIFIRDKNHPSKFDFCPCPSCMLNFPQIKTSRKIGVLEHKMFKLDLDYDAIDNRADLDKLLQFIAESEIIITSSYHGWYWATLMGKKVIVMRPFSSKFNWLPWPPVFYSGDLDKDIQRAQSYTDALSEARNKTQEVYQYIKSMI